MSDIDASTPFVETTIELDVQLQHAGATWTLFRFDECLSVSEENGDRTLTLTIEQAANAEILTLGDAIDATMEEYAPAVDIFRLSVLLSLGAILVTPRVSAGRYRWPDGERAFACLAGPTGDPKEGYAETKMLFIDPYTKGMDYDVIGVPDRSAFGIARLFFQLALARGVRLAVERFHEKHGIGPSTKTTASTASCAP